MLTINQLFAPKTQIGRFGIEIEVEGQNLPPAIPYFKRVDDHSLRGESAEYVFEKPLNLDQVHKAMDAFTFYMNGVKVDDSDRTSVHVHLNVQQWTVKRVFTFFMLYAMFEEFLVKFCGESRENNLFCLRLKDAEGLILTLGRAFKRKRFIQDVASDRIRYAAVNFSAIPKYGSLEVRTMRGTTDANLILNWVNILNRLYEASANYPDPISCLSELSMRGPQQLALDIFGEQYYNLLPFAGDWEDVVMSNVRMLQDIAYLHNWEQDVVEPEIPVEEPRPELNIGAADQVLVGNGVRADNMRAFVARQEAAAVRVQLVREEQERRVRGLRLDQVMMDDNAPIQPQQGDL